MSVGLIDGLEIMAALLMASKNKISLDSYSSGVGWGPGQEKTKVDHRFCGPQDLGKLS